MSQQDLSQGAAPSEKMAYRAPFEALREGGDTRLLLIGDHASNAVPQAYDSLGLSPGSFARHIAYDLGVHELASALSQRLNAPAVLAGFSRLLIDPNRGEDDPTLVMRLSDGEIIPGNAAANAAEIARRLADYHRPYHAAVDGALTRAFDAGVAPMLVSIHSFTPAWRGQPRPWHCGILWWGDKATAEFCLGYLRTMKDLKVGDNQPYSGALEGDSMDRHGTGRGISHVLIEIRQDLIAGDAGRREWVERLSPLLAQLAARGRRLT